jgi:RHS repeat-associated protein
MIQPGRKYSATGAYRYGFNGKENDNEVKGEGNQQDYGMRIYDPRLGRFLSVDPICRNYPELTPYQFASNRPIEGIDMDGLEFEPYWATTVPQKILEMQAKYSPEQIAKWDKQGLMFVVGALTLGWGVAALATAESGAVLTTIIKTAFRGGGVGAIVNTSVSIVKGDDLYTTLKSATTGFLSGAILGAYGKLNTIKEMISVGAFSSIVADYANQSIDISFEEKKEYNLTELLTSGILGSIATIFSEKIVNYVNAQITKKFESEIVKLESESSKAEIRKTIRKESPQLGPEAVKKELRSRVSEFKRLLKQQEVAEKIAAKQAIEKAVDELKEAAAPNHN